MKSTVQLKPYRISNGAATLKDLPRRIKLANWGRNESVNGPIVVNETTARLMPHNQKQLGYDRVALDYEHNTVPDSPEYKRTTEPRKVAGYGVPLLIPGEGLFLDEMEYTPAGREFAREYIDLSPTPSQTPAGEVVFLHSAALCRQGAVDGLTFFSVQMEGAAMMADGAQKNQDTQETEIMDKIMALLRSALGLGVDADEAAIGNALKGVVAYSARIDALETQHKQIIGSDGKLTLLSAGLDGLKTSIGEVKGADVTALKTQVTTLQAELDSVQKNLVCYHARLEGKVVPLDAAGLAKTDLATLQGIVANITPTVPVLPLTPQSVQAHALGGSLSDQDKDVAKSFGFTPEEVAKANGIKV